MKRQFLPIVLCLLVITVQAQSQWTTITNGALWKDTSGDPVEAHGAGFLKYNGKWYMAGEDRSEYNQGVNLYSSTDLQTWTFENKIIPPSAYSSERFIERAKLLRCPTTGKFVVWCHYEGEDYLASEAAVFYSDSINSTYTFHWGGRPLGIKARDCNVFVDNDGTAYFIATTNENTDLGLFRLSEDYLSIEEHTLLFDNEYREAPAIIRVGDTYFMISSGLTGWDPNQAQYSYSDSLTGGWSPLTNLGNKISFDTQAASILTIEGSQQTTYLYVGDRWIDPGLAESKTIIFPISFSGNSIDFEYSRQFDIDFSTGETRETPRSDMISKSNWSVLSVSSEETSNENGAAANAIDGDPSTTWHTQYSGSTASHPHEIVVDMGAEYEVTGFICEPRNDNDITGIIRDYQLYFSTDSVNWGAPVAGGWMLYNTEIAFEPVNARYFRLLALSEWSGYDYAAVAEFEVIQNTNNETVEFITWSQLNNDEWDSLKVVVEPELGDSVKFGPQATITGGSWTWYGPNDFIASTREILIDSIEVADEGVYTAVYADKYGNTSILEMRIDVPGEFSSNFTYEIVNRNSGKCLRTLNSSTADGASVVQYDCDGDASSFWLLEDAGNGEYHLVNNASGKFADIANGSTSPGASTIIWPGNGGANQRWSLEEQDSGYYQIVNVNSGLLLDINSSSTDNNAECIQWGDTGGDNQHWKIKRLDNSNSRIGSSAFTENDKEPFQIVLYPNPVTDVLRVTLSSEIGAGANLTIYDASGRVVFIKENVVSDEQVDLSKLTKGLYNVVISKGNLSVTKKLMK